MLIFIVALIPNRLSLANSSDVATLFRPVALCSMVATQKIPTNELNKE